MLFARGYLDFVAAVRTKNICGGIRKQMLKDRLNISYAPIGRASIHIDAYNFSICTYDGLGFKVDFIKLRDYLSRNSLLLRAYYYAGVFDEGAIEQVVQFTHPEDPDKRKQDMKNQRESEKGFHRALARSGFKVVTKPVKVFRNPDGKIKIKADMDIELAVDMMRIADRCDIQVLVSGDGDFAPLIYAVGQKGVRVVVVSTQSREAHLNANYRASDDLLDAADEFIDVANIKNDIIRKNNNHV